MIVFVRKILLCTVSPFLPFFFFLISLKVKFAEIHPLGFQKTSEAEGNLAILAVRISEGKYDRAALEMQAARGDFLAGL